MEFLKCRDVRCKGREKRNKPTYVVRFHATAGCNARTCAESHFGENLLPAAVFAPAAANCLKSLISYAFGILRHRVFDSHDLNHFH